MPRVTRVERGWPGHYCCADDCTFRRNTLLLVDDKPTIVVSTVGAYRRDQLIEPIGIDRFYETMAFPVDKDDDIYHDADTSRHIPFESEWRITKLFVGVDNKANDMHEAVVAELTQKLEGGDISLGVRKTDTSSQSTRASS